MVTSFDSTRSNKNGDMPHCACDGDSSDGKANAATDTGTGGSAKLGGAALCTADGDGLADVCNAATIGVREEDWEWSGEAVGEK